MTQQQRSEHFSRKKAWCGLESATSEPDSMGILSDLHGRHTAGSRRLFDVCIPLVARTLRFGLLPLALLANGHSFFVQQLQLQTGVWPAGVHATYQFEDAVDCAFGKRERMREWGLWLADGGNEDDVDEDEAAGSSPQEGGGGDEGSEGGVGGAEVYDDEGDACSVAALAPGYPTASAVADIASGERFLVLTDDDDGPLPPSMSWDHRDPHRRGRQHVRHLESFRQRLSSGVLLARILNRTVVLPPFYCYCDKYWARLTRCTVGEQALASQPLPFRCPMDHVLPIGSWHGKYDMRRARSGRCILPERPDMHPDQGFPYRTSGWLRALQGAPPQVASFGASLMPKRDIDFFKDRFHSDLAVASGLAVLPAGVDATPPHGAELLRGAPLILKLASSDAEIRQTVKLSGWGSQPLLHVSLQHASSMLGCMSDTGATKALLQQLFRNRWCWRPEEMTEPRHDPVTNTTVDVCVWGLAVPTEPPPCPTNN